MLPHPNGWIGFFLAEYWYNTSWHSALAKSSFEVLYGYSPHHFGIRPSDACKVTFLQDECSAQEKATMISLIQQHLSRAQHRMKVQADKHRRECTFAVNDWVYLKLQPYIQSSLAPRSNQKLTFKLFGPFKILSNVTYKFLLLETSKIHPVFHVSQLK